MPSTADGALRAFAIATPAGLPPLRDAVAGFAEANGFADGPLSDVRLAVAEALANVVVHAYRDRAAPGFARVRAAVTPDGLLEVEIADDGVGPARYDGAPGAGLGCEIMRNASVLCDIAPNVGAPGTSVRLQFRIPVV